MIYGQTLTVPPNTPIYNPVYETLLPGVGFFQDVTILFPSGCLGAVGVRILDGGSQIVPFSGWIFDNDKSLVFQVGRRLQGSPYRVIIQGHSNAADWEHTVSFRFNITQ